MFLTYYFCRSLFIFSYFSVFLAKSYHSRAAIGSVPETPHNKRLLANKDFDKIFEKYLTESSFIIKLQTRSLKNHSQLNFFKGIFQRLFKNLKDTFFSEYFLVVASRYLVHKWNILGKENPLLSCSYFFIYKLLQSNLRH